MDFKILTKKQDLNSAFNLLYKCYIENMNWKIPENNFSKIEIQDYENNKVLIDNFTPISTWFGVFNNGKICACGRLVPNKNASLEFTNYCNSDIKIAENSYEMNRIAVESGFENTNALFELIGGIISYANIQNFETLYTTVTFPQPGSTLELVGWEKIKNSEFKYDKNDPSQVFVLKFNALDPLCIEKFNNIISKFKAA